MTDEVTPTQKLDKDTVDGFVEAIKARILDEGLYDDETMAALKTKTKALRKTWKENNCLSLLFISKCIYSIDISILTRTTV